MIHYHGLPITPATAADLRMLDPGVFSRFPFASADSTNIGRNIGIDQAWIGPYAPPTKESRTQLMRSRIEAVNAPPAYNFQPEQLELAR